MRKGKSQAFEDEYDDDYDYDDDYGYDEEEETPKTTNKPAPKGKQTANTQPAPKWAATTTTTNKNNTNNNSSPSKVTPATSNSNSVPVTGLQPTPADQEIIDQMLPVLRSTMTAHGLKASDYNSQILIESLRTANYDVEETIVELTKKASTLTTATSATSATAPAPKPAAKHAAKVISIGKKNNNPNNITQQQPTTTCNNDDDQQQQEKSTSTQQSQQQQQNGGSKALKNANATKCELSEIKDSSGKTHLSIVFAGHVDHGKSTTVGHLLYQLGKFTEREVKKMEEAAKRAGKTSFHFAWLLDQSDEERRRGVTIDSGVHAFESQRHTVSILDAPGHEQFIENMASSSAQADVAVLIISGKPEELAVGLEHNTRKHVQILKRIGISRLIIAVNKMDHVNYDEAAFKESCAKIDGLLKECQFDPATQVVAYLPISGLFGVNLMDRPSADNEASSALAKWYKGPSLLEVIDGLDPVGRLAKFPLRFVVHDVNHKSGSISGKIECGSVCQGDQIVFLPSNCKISIRTIEHSVTGIVKKANAGDHVEIGTSSDIATVSSGNIGCFPLKATKEVPHCLVSSWVEASVQTYGQNAKSILPGHAFVMMLNGVQVPAKVRKLLQKMDMATGNWSPRGGFMKSLPKEVQGRVLIELEYPIAFERADVCMPLAKFLMKQEMYIVGGGIIESEGEIPAGMTSSSAHNPGGNSSSAAAAA